MAALVWGAVLASYSGAEPPPREFVPFALGMSFQEFLLSLFTLMLVIIGVLQFVQLRRTNDSAAIIERAYVKMSHVAPGVQIEQWPDQLSIRIRLQVKNWGRTPATISDAQCYVMVLRNENDLPTHPEYPETTSPQRAFLVTDDYFFLWVVGAELISSHSVGEIMFANRPLCVFGYVDYIDMFGYRHRAEYGRLYDRRSDIQQPNVSDEEFAHRSNLVIIASNEYNYDRRREPGEGKDWTESV